jgi:hypothetical protein
MRAGEEERPQQGQQTELGDEPPTNVAGKANTPTSVKLFRRHQTPLFGLPNLSAASSPQGAISMRVCLFILHQERIGKGIQRTGTKDQ